MYEKKVKNPLAGKPSFLRIKFPDEQYEADGLEVLHGLGVPFGLGKNYGEYIVNSAQCFILTRKKIKYKRYSKLYPDR